VSCRVRADHQDQSLPMAWQPDGFRGLEILRGLFRHVCFGTVYVNDPAAELPIDQGIRPDLPQITCSRLDPSFLADLHTILLGRTRMDIVEDFQNGRVAKGEAIRRVAQSIPIPKEHSIQLYVCSDDMCNLLAAAKEDRVADVVQRWRVLLWPSLQPSAEPEAGRRFRGWVLRQLVTLAQEAVRSDRKLMIRTEYRRHTRDATTGAARGPEQTRH
jgi:hypothetical protein